MVLTKKDFDEKNKLGIEQLFKTACPLIDAYLNDGTLTIHIKPLIANLPAKFSTKYSDLLIEKIITAYRAAGWKVERVSGYDQRDGDDWDYLTFS